MFQKLFQLFLQKFVKTMGRGPQNPAEWMRIQDDVVRHLNKTKGAPSIKKEPTLKDVLEGKTIEDAQGKTWDFDKFKWRSEDAPLRGGKPTLVEEKITIDDLLKGPVKSKGPKGQRVGDFSQKKGEVIPFPHKGISKEEWIARKKQENKDAIRRFKEKNPKTVEDFRDKDDWDPYGMAQGGIAPLVGEPSYAADFYDDRTPMKKGRKVKKKKLTEQEKIKELIKRMPRPFWRQYPHGKKRYKKRKDLPEGILELLEKDPGFDREAFEDAYWAGEGFRHTDPGWSSGLRGQYSPMTGNIELNLAPFGEEEYPHWDLRSPHQDPVALKDVDKAKIALHELRHKNIMEDKELFMTQPEWVQKQEGPGYLPKGGVTGHELYNRFLDQRYYPPEEDPGPNEPYFDKILKDYWEPHAKAYEDRAKRRLEERRGEGIETLASQGGRIGMAGGGLLKKFIEKLFIKASNDIRLGRGKWKGLDQKQRIVQHDNLTKKVTEFQKTGNTA